MRAKNKKNSVRESTKTILSLLIMLGFLTFLAAYAPARDFFFGSFAGLNTQTTLPRQVSTANLPITGTFISPDLFYSSESEYRQFFQEMSDTGIDTIILLLNGVLTKNCTTNKYTEQIDTRLYAGNPQVIPLFVKLAKEKNMKIYFSVAEYTLSYPQCFYFSSGNAKNEATDKGRLIGFSLRQVAAIKKMVEKQNIAWSDPTIAGFYIFPEVDASEFSRTDSSALLFFKELSVILKQKEPTKKLLYSPYQSEGSNYSLYLKSYSNLYSQTKIDIVSPQDSMGTGLTSTYARSAEHYRALRDAAAKTTGREAWANIETFGSVGVIGNTKFAPSTFSKVKQQIAAAKPYTTKRITWIYSHTMLVNPLSDNMASKNQYALQYIPEYAVRRTSLRRDYMSEYGALSWSVSNVSLTKDFMNITGQFGNNGNDFVLQVMYINTQGNIVRTNLGFTANGNVQVVSISRGLLFNIDGSKPYTATVISKSSGTPTPTSTRVPISSPPVGTGPPHWQPY